MTIKAGASIELRTGSRSKSVAANAHAQRSLSKSLDVTPKSSKVIDQTVLTHRDALKRLADR